VGVDMGREFYAAQNISGMTPFLSISHATSNVLIWPLLLSEFLQLPESAFKFLHDALMLFD
jgi:hypothetical protein